MDPVGAIVISLVIIYRWIDIMDEQMKKVVGHTAPEEFIKGIEEMAYAHDNRLVVDCIRAYHFGARYNVEMEIVLPGEMTVATSHDIALELQHKIEKLEDVERAYVHVDYELRDGLVHKVERELVLASKNSPFSPADAIKEGEGSPHGLRRRKQIELVPVAPLPSFLPPPSTGNTVVRFNASNEQAIKAFEDTKFSMEDTRASLV